MNALVRVLSQRQQAPGFRRGAGDDGVAVSVVPVRSRSVAVGRIEIDEDLF